MAEAGPVALRNYRHLAICRPSRHRKELRVPPASQPSAVVRWDDDCSGDISGVVLTRSDGGQCLSNSAKPIAEAAGERRSSAFNADGDGRGSFTARLVGRRDASMPCQTYARCKLPGLRGVQFSLTKRKWRSTPRAKCERVLGASTIEEECAVGAMTPFSGSWRS